MENHAGRNRKQNFYHYSFSALFTFWLSGRHRHLSNMSMVAGQCHQLALGDVILAQLAWPLNDVMFCLHSYTECHYAKCHT